jgi:hypothetical protein
MTKGKTLVTRKSDYDVLRKMLTFKTFHERFELSIELTTELMSDACVKNSFTKCETVSKDDLSWHNKLEFKSVHSVN